MRLALASVLIQIVGLAVLQNQEKLGVRAIFPRTGHHTESHTVIIAYRDADRLTISGWTEKKLEPVQNDVYQYVELNGERISFAINGRNKIPRVPEALPKLTKNCAPMKKLGRGYLPPSYGSAAAVADFTAGTMWACSATATGVSGRIDTRIEIANKGPFKVIASGKSITFEDNAQVFIANVPTRWLNSPPGSFEEIGGPHSAAYFGMSASGNANCSLEKAGAVDPCAPTDMKQAAAAHATHYPEFPVPSAMMTYECSNTQWP